MRKMPTLNRGYDLAFLFLIFVLLVFGVLMVYNASVVFAGDVFGGKYHFLYLQTGWALIGLLCLFVFSRINLNYLRKISPALLVITILFLIFVLLPTIFSPEINGARRWIIFNPPPFPSLPGVGRLGFQPSDLAKITVALFFAHYVANVLEGRLRIKKHLKVGLIILFIAGLIVMEPDFDAALIILSIAGAILFASGIPLLYFSVLVPVLLLIALFFILGSTYRRQRLLTFFSPETAGTSEAGYHVNQVLIALGSGGILGVGLGNSRQKYGFLPEVTADSIFAVIGEELGFVGAVIVLSLLGFLIIRGFVIARRAKTVFGRLLVVGIMAWISLQVFLNLMAMVKLIPLTGIPLPLVSYGGSSMIFSLIGLGLVLNVSKNG